jgi:hypothetical protein
MTDKNEQVEEIRKIFEHCTESYYEGDFAKYDNGEYVSASQADDFTMFRSGFKQGQAAEIAELREALRNLVNAGAIAKVPDLVAGWNGADGNNPQHQANLGAVIKTNCMRVYELERLMREANAALARAAADMGEVRLENGWSRQRVARNSDNVASPSNHIGGADDMVSTKHRKETGMSKGEEIAATVDAPGCVRYCLAHAIDEAIAASNREFAERCVQYLECLYPTNQYHPFYREGRDACIDIIKKAAGIL